MTKRYSFVPPGGGDNYDWSADHTFVKVSAADTGGMYTLMEDNLKHNFQLGLHLHKYHTETFKILSGEIEFYVDGDWMTAQTGACLHIPPGVPHACTLSEGMTDARMLMIYQPSGFDQYLVELSQLTETDFADKTKMAALNEKYDIINIGDLPTADDGDVFARFYSAAFACGSFGISASSMTRLPVSAGSRKMMRQLP